MKQGPFFWKVFMLSVNHQWIQNSQYNFVFGNFFAHFVLFFLQIQ